MRSKLLNLFSLTFNKIRSYRRHICIILICTHVARAHRYSLHTNDAKLLYPNLRNIDVLKKTISFSLKREDINVRKIENCLMSRKMVSYIDQTF